MQQILDSLNDINGELAKINGRLDTMDAELHRHGVLLESMNSDLKQTMEVVVANREATERGFAAVLAKIGERAGRQG